MGILRIIVEVGILEEMDGEGFMCEESFAVWRSANENKRLKCPFGSYGLSV